MRKWAIAMAAAAMAAPLIATALVFWPIGAAFLSASWEAKRPETIGWEGKTAWRKCEAAIAGSIAWPAEHAARCEALSMCANEAPLTPAGSAALTAEAWRAGCADF